VAQPAPKSTTGVPQMIGLFVFVATAAIFLGALANQVLAGLHTVQQFAVAFSYVVAVVALVVMFVDVYDLWVRGRRFNKAQARGLRMIVLVAILGSMATTLLGRNMTLVIFLMPSIIIYYMTMRPAPSSRRAAGGGATTRGATGGGGTSGAGRSGGKSRQRKGGKKHR
jgi:UDP-N-acetylmuramyl pentapeptide phosphotransferase/UDP-N-acetylglucosamine-1-phosphate transferase